MAYRVSVWPAERETMCRGGSWSVTALPTLSVTSTGNAPASGAGVSAGPSPANTAVSGVPTTAVADGVGVEPPPPSQATAAAASSAASTVTSMQDLISVTSRDWPGRHPGRRYEKTLPAGAGVSRRRYSPCLSAKAGNQQGQATWLPRYADSSGPGIQLRDSAGLSPASLLTPAPRRRVAHRRGVAGTPANAIQLHSHSSAGEGGRQAPPRALNPRRGRHRITCETDTSISQEVRGDGPWTQGEGSTRGGLQQGDRPGRGHRPGAGRLQRLHLRPR